MSFHPRFESTAYRGRVPGLAGFGKMFDLEPHGEGTDAATLQVWLNDLGAAMRDDLDPDTNKPFPNGDHPSLPAGYTYLGQFIDHDLTFEPTRLASQQIEIATLTNFRTPALDLDSLLGFGPTASPHLYASQTPGALATGPVDRQARLPHDLARLSNRTPLIGDPRNDENLAVAQLCLAFIHFYNKVLNELIAGNGQVPDLGPAGGSWAEKAARIVRWHYQWIVLNDFLPRILDTAVLAQVITNGPTLYQPDPLFPFMPVEFAGAAYRLGHSLVRQRYHVNTSFRDQPLDDLFGFTGGGANGPPPLGWALNWNRFFDIDPDTEPNKARKIDPYTAPSLHALNTGAGPIDLAARNLVRGWTWKLPSGQRVAGKIGVASLSPDEILSGPDGQFCKESNQLRAGGFQHSTPLWYYVLKEAQVTQQGERLGPVGSRIVAEVFVALLRGDTDSYMSVQPGWKPTLPTAQPGTFTMADMFRFLPDAVNPNGGDQGPV